MTGSPDARPGHVRRAEESTESAAPPGHGPITDSAARADDVAASEDGTHAADQDADAGSGDEYEPL